MESDLDQARRVQAYYGDSKATYDEFSMERGKDIIYMVYPLETLAEKIPVESDIDVAAQVEAIKWLQGQTTNEFVLAWLVQKRGVVERAGGVKA